MRYVGSECGWIMKTVDAQENYISDSGISSSTSVLCPRKAVVIPYTRAAIDEDVDEGPLGQGGATGALWRS